MSSSNDDLIRRSRVSTKRIKSQRNGSHSNEDASARKEFRRNRRRLRGARNRRIALALFAWIIFIAAVFFLRLRTSRTNESGRKARRRGGKPIGLRSGNDLDSIGMRYLDPRQLPPLPGEPDEPYKGKGRKGGFRGEGDDGWKSDSLLANSGPKVDYTKHEYQYPELMFEPPNDGSYPPLERMATVFETWGQDDLDNPPNTLVEVLQHFDFQDPDQLEVSELMNQHAQVLVSGDIHALTLCHELYLLRLQSSIEIWSCLLRCTTYQRWPQLTKSGPMSMLHRISMETVTMAHHAAMGRANNLLITSSPSIGHNYGRRTCSDLLQALTLIGVLLTGHAMPSTPMLWVYP